MDYGRVKRDEQRLITGLVGVLRDITERRHLERQVLAVHGPSRTFFMHDI